MKQIMKHPISIKWKILGSLVFFIGIVIIVLWLFQVFFLERFYMYIKSNAVKSAASQINNVINTDSYASKLNNIASENDLCVYVYENKDTEIGDLNIIYPNSQTETRCRIKDNHQNKQIIAELQQDVKENGGIRSQLLEEEQMKPLLPPMDEGFKSPLLDNKQFDNNLKSNRNRIFQSMTFISVVEAKEKGMLKTILVETQLTPVNATIETIKAQFFIIAIILTFVAIGLALYLSKKIAAPMIKISNSAKDLAKGDYDVTFHGHGYQEIEELSGILNYAAKELSKVEGLRRELIANMSHDLRTPLTMITGYSEIMRDIPGENTPENVQIIIDETKRLTTLVNDMLDLSKLQSGVLILHVIEFDITQEICAIIKRYDKLLLDKKIQIVFTYDEHIMVKGDVVKINQVIYNLINNAINYCGEDHQVIVKQQIRNQRAYIQIIDHGEGIDKEQLPYIWERYYKINKTHIRSKVGTGLGLSIVKVILDLHKTTYGVTSKRTEGTIFWFYLPIMLNDA